MDATAYLQQELRSAQRTFRNAGIAMAVVLVVFVGYFQWLSSQLATVLTPASVAELIVNQARGALPEITTSLKTNLQEEAPSVVSYVMHQAVEQVLPLVAQSFQTNLDQYSHEVSAAASDHSLTAFAASIRAYKANTKIAKNENPTLFAARLSAHVDADLGNQLDVVAKDNVKQRLDHTGETLKRINTELSMLAHQSRGDHDSEMGRRLITTWWTFLDRGRPKPEGVPVEPKAPTKVTKPSK
jgi:hypothetical protein